jgi:hypothetical protein
MDTGITPSASEWQVVNDYPIVYKVVPWVRALTALAALAFTVDMSYQVLMLSRTQGVIAVNPFPASICVLMAALLAYAVVWAFTARITLYAGRFEQRKPFIERKLQLCDITGRRYTKGPGAGYPVIVPKGTMSFSIDTTSYGLDERFNRWFLNLKDLS